MNAKIQFLLLIIGMNFWLVVEASPQEAPDHPPMDRPITIAHEPTVETGMMRPRGFDVADQTPRSGFSEHVFDLFEDQKRIWTSPARIRFSDATWLVPLGGLAAGLFVTDRQHSASLSQNPTTIRHYKTFSNVGLASLVGTGAGLYLFSYPMHNEHWRETGFLAGEAALNSLITVEALKYSLRRARPYQDNGSGSFFNGGTSFPSEHAAAAWSIAGVIAHEYPGKLPTLLAYGMASAISFSRVHAHQHFPSDVLVGSVLGYLIAQSVYTRRYDPETGGRAWSLPSEYVDGMTSRSPAYMGSPYVPLDSWIYPAMERLAAFGYFKSEALGMRPWTRQECVRLLGEAAERRPDSDGPSEVQKLYAALTREFYSDVQASEGAESFHAELESVYQRTVGISGQPLTDGYHFGQTISNDYGRPFQGGFNTVVGSSSWASVGPFVIYARGEYQYSPSAPAVSSAVLNFISGADNLPSNAPSTPMAAVARFRLLDAYVGMTLANWQISFGKQSLWWGPSEGGTMAFTNNAEPITMFRLNRVSPFRLPWFFRYLGDIRTDFFLGQVAGQEFINHGTVGMQPQGQYGRSLTPQPFLSGAKFSFKFTPNFEFNISKTSLYGGPGNPLTLKTLYQSFLGVHVNGEALGDGRSSLDFSYRVPKLRNWLSFYGDAFQEDEISPLNRPYKAAFQAGLYLARVPRVPKLDLRIEGGTTSPINFPDCNGCFYHNFQYVNGYTNNGVLMGTWIGRAAQGESIWSNYWLSPTKRIGIELKHRKVDRQFLPQGGTQNDVGLNFDFLAKSGFRVSGLAQYERWQIPLLATNQQSNFSASFQIGYWPHRRTR